MYFLNPLLIVLISTSAIFWVTIPICSLHTYSALDQVLCIAYFSIMFLFQSAVNTASTLILPQTQVGSYPFTPQIWSFAALGITFMFLSIIFCKVASIYLFSFIQCLPKTQSSSFIKTLITPQTCQDLSHIYIPLLLFPRPRISTLIFPPTYWILNSEPP